MLELLTPKQNTDIAKKHNHIHKAISRCSFNLFSQAFILLFLPIQGRYQSHHISYPFLSEHPSLLPRRINTTNPVNFTAQLLRNVSTYQHSVQYLSLGSSGASVCACCASRISKKERLLSITQTKLSTDGRNTHVPMNVRPHVQAFLLHQLIWQSTKQSNCLFRWRPPSLFFACMKVIVFPQSLPSTVTK